MKFKLAIFSTAALLFAATHAVAGGPPPWAGGSGGNPGNGGLAFDGWAGGSAMSGSANDFGFSNSFDEAGITGGAFAAEGWNKGSSVAGGSFSDNGFDGYAASENFGGMTASDFGAGLGADHRMDFNAQAYGQSFGEVEWGATFSSW